MSDDDDFMQDSGDEGCVTCHYTRAARGNWQASRSGFIYDDDSGEESGDVVVENKYYNAKQIKVDNPEEAIDEFLGIPALEEEKGDW